MAAVRCAVEVVAGIVPGTAMPELTKRFFITEDQWKGGSTEGADALLEATEKAIAYLQTLQAQCVNGRTCNWIRLDFVWF